MLNAVGKKGLDTFGYGDSGIKPPDFGDRGTCDFKTECKIAKHTPVWREAIHIGQSEKDLCFSQKAFFTSEMK
jgi:hypothetical protein